MATKLNLYSNGEIVKSVDKNNEGKTSITIDGLSPNTDYEEGTYQVSYSKDGNESKKVNVPAFKTLPVGVQSVTLDVEDLTLDIGQTHQLKATVKPDNATDKSVSYSSDNPDIVTVTNDGLVETKTNGSAKVTVKTNDGNKTAIVNVTVKEPIPDAPSDITVSPKQTTVDITV